MCFWVGLCNNSRAQLHKEHYLEHKMADSQSLTGSGSGSEGDSEEENESGTTEEETSSSEEEEEEEEEEPLLKYQRFGAGLGFGEEISGDSKMISCIAVHYRVSNHFNVLVHAVHLSVQFIVYGMHDGMVFCSDLQGNRLSGKDFSIVSHHSMVVVYVLVCHSSMFTQ